MENIIENNKIIAEFLDWEFDDLSETFETPFLKLVEPQAFGDEQFSCKLQDFELEFHTDWNWLMKLVEKIESLNINGVQWTVLEDESDVTWNFEVNINSKQCTINRCAYNGDEEDFLSLYDCRNYENITKIEAVIS